MSIQRFTLPNGLKILAEPMHAAPVVAMQAWVNVGSADERDEQAGIAHVHEHMLFKGTARRGVGAIARDVEAAGGEINAWTSFDQTVYHLVMAKDELYTGLDILSDALRQSSFDADELARELEVVVEEIRRSEDTPGRRVSKAQFELAYPTHPYGKPVIGTEASVRAMTRERILEFYGEYYRPDEITLVVVGDFEGRKLNSHVQKLFGDWQNPSTQPAKRQRHYDGEQSQLVLRHLREDVRETRMSFAWRVPEVSHEDIAAIDVLSTILGHGETSRLFLQVRRKKQLVNDCYAYSYTPRDPGLLMVGAGLEAANLDDAVLAMLEEVYAMGSRLISEEELERTKTVILSDAAYQRETVQGQARKRGFFEVVAGDYLFEERYNNTLRALRPEDIRDVARRYLHTNFAAVLQTPADVEPWPANKLKKLTDDAYQRANGKRSKVPAQGSFGVHRIQVPNGPLVLLRPEDSPIIAMRAVALGGLRWETPATYGRSFLLGALWGMATESFTPEALSRHIASLGGTLGAYAGRNSVGMRGEFLRERGSEGLDVFCEALLAPAFAPADLERERAVILQRIRNREDNPAGVCFDAFAAALFPTHPYGQRITGSEQTVQNTTLANLEQVRQEYASPDKLILTVAGGMDVDSVAEVLARVFSGCAPSAALAPAPAVDSPPNGPIKVHKTLNKQQAHILVGSMGATIFDKDRYGIEVLTTILSGQSGRLFLDLRDKQSLAYSVSSSNLEGLDPGYVVLHIGTAADKVPQALAGLYHHIDLLRQEWVSEEELLRAQRYLLGSHAIDLQRSGSRAMLMALNQCYGLGYDDHQRYDERIRAVSRDDIQRIAQTYLAPERLVEATVGPGDGNS